MKTRVLVLIIFLLGGAWYWLQFLCTPLLLSNQPPLTFIYQPGESLKQLAYQLHKISMLKHPYLFIVLARLQGCEHTLQAGEYAITPGMRPKQLLAKMQHGLAIKQVFTIVEGWTFQQVLTALANNAHVIHTLQNVTPEQIMQQLGFPGTNPEGRFAPETYVFSGSITDLELLHTAYRHMEQWLATAWHQRADDLPYNCMYDALIVASIIEKETAVTAEKAEIAGVIVRRLKKGMLLQLDPTVLYGLHKKTKLTTADLRNPNVYNTYVHLGLPPAPISMPGHSSIDAALHPKEGQAMYFVAKGDGTHVFSETLMQQATAIRKYLLKRKP